MKILVTGGAGFIGSALVRHIVQATEHDVFVIDKLTYAGNLASLASVSGSARYKFSQTDICDRAAVERIVTLFEPDAIMHLAAESHVDRSIDAPAQFISTNIVGTHTLLDVALSYWNKVRHEKPGFRMLHISTDEVFGALSQTGKFTEETRYDPRSPYSATKAASDHLVRAWYHTFGLPVLITNCSNNYGPCQFPEKLMPLMIIKALNGERMPVYGQGQNVRDWLFVDDHVQALMLVLAQGQIGQTYAIGGDAERRNIDVVSTICDVMDRIVKRADGASHRELIEYVPDRPGHDFRYAIDFSKIRDQLGWKPSRSFEAGIDDTVNWYLQNKSWWEPLMSKADAGVRRGVVAGGR